MLILAQFDVDEWGQGFLANFGEVVRIRSFVGPPVVVFIEKDRNTIISTLLGTQVFLLDALTDDSMVAPGIRSSRAIAILLS